LQQPGKADRGQKMKTLIYDSEEQRFIPNFGVFSKGDTAEYNEVLLGTGLFKIQEEKTTLEKGAK
jgi:hypothetical protein